jgi:hypothetical protein
LDFRRSSPLSSLLSSRLHPIRTTTALCLTHRKHSDAVEAPTQLIPADYVSGLGTTTPLLAPHHAM